MARRRMRGVSPLLFVESDDEYQLRAEAKLARPQESTACKNDA